MNYFLYAMIYILVFLKSTDWVFDQKAYMGYSIKELKFTQPKGDYADNIIYMSLTLHSSRYGDFTYTEYIFSVII